MIARKIVSVLKDERGAITKRDWARIGELATEKAALIDALEAGDERPTPEDMKQIERLASENARLLKLMHDAAGSAYARLSGILDRVTMIGYGEDGKRLRAGADNPFRRV